MRTFWTLIEPGTELVWGWALDAVCDHLQAITDGHIKDLLINIPPRTLKSTIVSVMFPPWEWLQDAQHRYLTCSYDKNLAVRDAVRSRRIIESPLYRELNRDSNGDQRFLMAGDQNVKSRYENTATGHRICASPGSSGTGEGGDRILVDDPHNVREAESDSQRKEVIDWWDKTMSSRRNDLRTDARIVIMQRLHQNDLAGHVLEKGYDHLCLPMLYEPDHPHLSRAKRYTFKDPRTAPGEILTPERVGPDEIKDMQTSMGMVAFVAQEQQRPSPSSGVIFKIEHYRRWSLLPILEECDRVFTSWDFAFEGTDKEQVERIKDPSFVVGQLWAVKGSTAWFIDEERGQWDFLQSCQAVVRMRNKWPQATAHLFEKKANGPAVRTVVKGLLPGVLMIEPNGSKIQRATACQPFVSAGNVIVPENDMAPWVVDWIAETTGFPFMKKDDRVDAMTQALLWANVTDAQRSIDALTRLIGGV